MANEEQLEILKQGVHVWNKWREENKSIDIDLVGAYLNNTNISQANLSNANLYKALLERAILSGTNLEEANLKNAYFSGADLSGAHLNRSDFTGATFTETILGHNDLRYVIGLNDIHHYGISAISTLTFSLSEGKISVDFLRGCGLSDWEIESVKLYNPNLTNQEISEIQYKMFDLRATQPIQISSLFISYSHADSPFVDKLEEHLNENGIRFWRDIHDAKAGRLEKQIDRAIRHNPTVLVILSENSTQSDWVEHEVRTARKLEKETGRDTLCPVALDDSWKDSPWPARVMEQLMEYNILDFSDWQNDATFGETFKKLIDGLELFYK